MLIEETTTIRELLLKHPQTRKVFEQYAIDYCCGGLHNLKTAAELAEIPIKPLIEAIESAIASRHPSERNWAHASPTQIVDHIQQAHHAYLKDELPRLHALIEKVLAAHPAHQAMLSNVKHNFDQLEAELHAHLLKEEQVLFPHIRQMETARREGLKIALPMSAGGPVRQMETEHEAAGRALNAIRDATSDYTLPEDACITFRSLFESLKEFEKDTHEHIHLENNILFPGGLVRSFPK